MAEGLSKVEIARVNTTKSCRMSRDILTRWVYLGQLANRVHNATFFSRAQVLWSYDLLPQPQRQFALTVNCFLIVFHSPR